MKKISLKKLSLEKKKKRDLIWIYLRLVQNSSQLKVPRVDHKFIYNIQNKLRYELIFFICNIVNPLLIWVSKIYI